jgi:MbtH protein
MVLCQNRNELNTIISIGGKMNGHDEEDQTIYKVVVNQEEQYSIWPSDQEIPLGWRDAGKQGPKAECLAHINTVWIDMRPLSLRDKRA